MLVLHGAWGVERTAGDAAFLFWGEEGRSNRVQATTHSLDGAAPLHPFHAPGTRLRETIGTLAALARLDVDTVESSAASWTIRLPTHGGRPVASPEALAAAVQLSEAHTDEVVLAPWQVRGRALRSASAAWMLALLPAVERPPSPELRLGADLRFWSAVAKFALDLVARERFVPTLEIEGVARARWRPILSDPRDAARFGALARGMPSACRAIGATTPTANAVLQRALSATVDALVVDGIDGRDPVWGGPGRGLPRPTTASDAWLFALVEGKSEVQQGGYDLVAFAERVADWIGPVAALAAPGALRTCFQLEPPDGSVPSGQHGARKGAQSDPRSWTLRFLLQAADDPSLLVSAERIWQERSDALEVLSRRLDRPQERFLSDLGRAAQLFPPLEQGLAESRPTDCRLTTVEAHQFLREAVPLLEESGFGVLVPPWWDRQGRHRLGVRLRLGTDPSIGSGQLGGQSLLSFDWKLALGDLEVDPAEFKRLARLKVPLVQVRGEWIELDPRKIEDAIKFWEKRRRAGPLSAADAIRLALGPIEEPAELPVVDVDAGGWLSELLRSPEDWGQRASTNGAGPRSLDAPAGFVGELRSYQARGAAWLRSLAERGLGGCLADDMGLGKTIQYIAFLLATRRSGVRALRPALLICPTSVLGNWRHEVGRFAPELHVYVHHGAQRLLGERFVEAVEGHDLVLSTYPLAYRDEKTLKTVAWSGVVLDEAQNVKNPTTRQARAVRAIARGPDGSRPYRFALTGTPVENRLSELWSILDFLNPGYLGSRDAFRRGFAVPIERWQSAERSAQLRRLVRPFVLRRLKTDPKVIQDLPEKQELKVFCTLTREQATLYQAVVDQMLGQIEGSEGIERRGRILTALLRLKQVCNHPANYLSDGSSFAGRSGKLARLEEMLEEALSEGDAALIFTQFAEFGGRLREYLERRLGREVLFLHGGTPARARDALVARFQSVDGPPIFLLSLKAGGTGLNLTRATHVFHFDRWWNPAVEDQATDRAFRIGQTRSVQVHKFVCAGTLEERIDDLIASKQALAQQVIGAGETWLTELSTDELADLMTLRAEAVVDD